MTMWRGFILVCVAGICLALYLGDQAPAQQQDGNRKGPAAEQAERGSSEGMVPKPDLSDLEQLRFLTDSDYPPFNYFDEEGALTGFNVDLARAICEELVVECDIRSVDWSGLVPALEAEETDAVIASIRTTGESLAGLDFTDAYYHTPARFVALKESSLRDMGPGALSGRKVAVVGGTAHEAYLRDFYAKAEIATFEDGDAAREALRAGEADVLFGDGISLMFWINGTASGNCCEFRSGPYAESRYFGEGVGIAIKRGERKRKVILNYALDRLRASGRLEELYLRYFPLNFF